MTWDELKEQDIQYIVEYINKELGVGKSLIKIAIESQTSESSIRKYLKNRGYKRVNNNFICNDEEGMRKVSKGHIPSNNDIVNQKDNLNVKKKLIHLAESYDTLIEMINFYKDTGNINIVEVTQSKEIKIALPSKPAKRTTIRLIKEISDSFDKFCDIHSEFTKTDLMSMALLEYMNTYSK